MRNHHIDIPKIRETLKLSRAMLAERLGVDVSTISRWERFGIPERGPAGAFLQRLAADAAVVAVQEQFKRQDL
jgi:DNA-binding transcriptional regulator YiaG